MDPFELERKSEEGKHALLRGAIMYRALLRAAETESVLVVGEAGEAVEHVNVARLLEGGNAQGLPFVLVEDLRGTATIAELVATRGAAHWQEAVELGRHLARALDALHAAGLVHGDLALSSVHVTSRWEPLLGRRLEAGEPARNLRELGAILYALLAGGLPHPEPVPLRAIVAEVPEKLERLVLDLLAGQVATAAQAALLLDGFRA